MTSTSDPARALLQGVTPAPGAAREEGPPRSHAAGQETQLDESFNIDQAREQALLEAYAGGDASALEELLEENESRIFAICMRMTGNVEAARDLTQDTFLRVIQGLPGFSGKSKLSTWITRIAINTCLTDRRRRVVRQTVSLEDPVRSDSPQPDTPKGDLLAGGREPGPSERVQLSEARNHLSAAMSKLDPERRAILILRDGQELEYAEIAAILGIPTGTVKSRLFRARVALRHALDALEQDGPRHGASHARSAEGDVDAAR